KNQYGAQQRFRTRRISIEIFAANEQKDRHPWQRAGLGEEIAEIVRGFGLPATFGKLRQSTRGTQDSLTSRDGMNVHHHILEKKVFQGGTNHPVLALIGGAWRTKMLRREDLNYPTMLRIRHDSPHDIAHLTN